MRYPVTSRRSILHCPVHKCAVALNDAGRIASTCPGCILEARQARRRLRTLARRRLAVV